MRMQMAMSICTGLKPQAGDGMGEKKERGRFTLRFNEGDPIHEAAIGLLELQSLNMMAQIRHLQIGLCLGQPKCI